MQSQDQTRLAFAWNLPDIYMFDLGGYLAATVILNGDGDSNSLFVMPTLLKITLQEAHSNAK